MRYLLSSLLLLTSFSALNAATFLERFNSLETDIEHLQDDVAKLKQNKGTTVVAPAPSLSSKEIRTLKKAIKTLTKSQASLKSKVNKMANRPVSAPVTVAPAAAQSHQEMLVDYEESDVDMDEIQEQFDEISKTISEMRKFTNGNHMKISADFRTAIDNINYTMADGSTTGNDALFTNRLWLNFKYKATSKISFSAQLASYKTYGARSGLNPLTSFDGFDWITNETPSDGTIRVKKAYYFYANDTFMGINIPWTFSVGRRPSTNGHLINLRDDDGAASPSAHTINVEFDGLSSKFDISAIGLPGLYIKFCIGRGGSNANEALAATPYATSPTAIPNIDLFGAIISLYNDGQYSVTTQTYMATNLIDLNQTAAGGVFETVGDLVSFTANFVADGIGEEGETFLWSSWLGNILDETIFFASYATSVTKPDAGSSMLGSGNSKVGYSSWVGLQLPTLSDKGRWGMEYNEGSQYWRSVTYAEDTLIGSKIATRGAAYEIYWTEPFANSTMSWQLRYTYIDYTYTGSNGFFGSVTGTPFTMAQAVGGGQGAFAVDKASDLRFYLRYRY